VRGGGEPVDVADVADGARVKSRANTREVKALGAGSASTDGQTVRSQRFRATATPLTALFWPTRTVSHAKPISKPQKQTSIRFLSTLRPRERSAALRRR
jgi:hypothetical protein